MGDTNQLLGIFHAVVGLNRSWSPASDEVQGARGEVDGGAPRLVDPSYAEKHARRVFPLPRSVEKTTAVQQLFYSCGAYYAGMPEHASPAADLGYRSALTTAECSSGR